VSLSIAQEQISFKNFSQELKGQFLKALGRGGIT